MSVFALVTANVALAYSAYAIGTASPGPSNLAVMATAMHRGRKPALIFATGVVAGSTIWGLLAAIGLSAILARYSQALQVMKVLGGLYLLWLAYKSMRASLEPRTASDEIPDSSRRSTVTSFFLRGMAMHLTNPKAIFVWLSIVALALPSGAQRGDALLIVAGCVPIGLFVFCGYALLFSTRYARSIYTRSRRWFDGTLALLFSYAGIRMLASRV